MPKEKTTELRMFSPQEMSDSMLVTTLAMMSDNVSGWSTVSELARRVRDGTLSLGVTESQLVIQSLQKVMENSTSTTGQQALELLDVFRYATTVIDTFNKQVYAMLSRLEESASDLRSTPRIMTPEQYERFREAITQFGPRSEFRRREE